MPNFNHNQLLIIKLTVWRVLKEYLVDRKTTIKVLSFVEKLRYYLIPSSKPSFSIDS